MLESENLVAWTAVAISGLAALLIVLWAGVAIRWRRVWGRRLGTLSESASRSDRLLAQLVAMLERTETETDVPGEQAGRAELEARRLRVLSRLGSTLDLDAVTHLALEYVIEEVGADGAVAVVREGERDPYVATFGLSTTESERELLGLSPDLNDARAVTLLYRYSPAEIENDAFPVTAGLAVLSRQTPVASELSPCSGGGRCTSPRTPRSHDFGSSADCCSGPSSPRAGTNRRAGSQTSIPSPDFRTSGTSPTASLERSRGPDATSADSRSSSSAPTNRSSSGPSRFPSKCWASASSRQFGAQMSPVTSATPSSP